MSVISPAFLNSISLSSPVNAFLTPTAVSVTVSTTLSKPNVRSDYFLSSIIKLSPSSSVGVLFNNFNTLLILI